MLALLVGIWVGLIRIGWPLPWFNDAQGPLSHGPLMVPGFLGTLIGLERAVALGVHRQAWGYAVPLLAGLGSVALIAGVPTMGAALMTLGSLGLVAVYGFLVRRQPTLFTATEGLGALALLVGNVVWLMGYPVYQAVPWWMTFLVLTIVGERLELSRMRRLDDTARWTFVGVGALTLIGTALTIASFDLGVRVLGLGFIGLALWLGVYDVIARTIRQPGLPRFSAVCLGSGFVWLGLGGALALSVGGVPAGPLYDAWLHAVFLGFVFSMIFGHAPIIFPAVLRVRMAYSRTFYAHWAVLHLSLIWRLLGDLMSYGPGREWGGGINALAILLFLVNTGRSIRLGQRQTESTTARSEASGGG